MLVDPEGMVTFGVAEDVRAGDVVRFPTGWATVREVTFTGRLGEATSVAIEGQNVVEVSARRKGVTLRVHGVRMRMVVPLAEQVPLRKVFDEDETWLP